MRYLAKILISSIIMILCSYGAAFAAESLLPLDSARSAIEALAISKQSKVDFKEIKKLKVDNQSIPIENQRNFKFDTGRGTTLHAHVPLIIPNTMILQLVPNITDAQLKSLIEEKNLRVIYKIIYTGKIQVETDLSKYYIPKPMDKSINDTILRGAIEASDDFKKDPRIRSAAPDLVRLCQVNRLWTVFGISP